MSSVQSRVSRRGAPDITHYYLTMHQEDIVITPSDGNTMSQFQSSHAKRRLNLQEKVEA